ncbi:acid-sensing ion channel 5-like [Hydractinia symbiolongicarpus]|uniref:acid-sensing ion channel 5-like n=1 Tax=Hydractinia symbiolongicarpus TaxID=13093 RepID=UPI00254E082D|nr:acid-sensing ion channel 5-like [Hydractinia symbiolongicarpus]
MKRIHTDTNGNAEEKFKIINADGHYTDVDKSISEEEEEKVLLEEMKQDEKTKQKIHEYIEGFTVHGLAKIFTGNRVESIFWAVIVACGLILTISVTQGLFRKYLRYEIYTEVKSQVTGQNTFPTLTICEDKFFKQTYFSFCGESLFSNSSNPDCKNINDYKVPSALKSVPGSYWTNGFFNVTACDSWDGKNCISNAYFKSVVHHNNSCIQFNWDGTAHDLYSHFVLRFEYIPPAHLAQDTPSIVVIPHDSRLNEIDLTSTIAIEPHKKYYVVMDKTQHKRLPSPYSSNCTNDKVGDIFPGKYGRRQCIESNVYERVYKKCGAVVDYIQQFFSPEFIEKYKRNYTIDKLRECIIKFRVIDMSTQKYDCPFPCDELEFGMVTSFTNLAKTSNKFVYTMDLNYRIVDMYRIYEEKALYNWDQMAAEIGGFIGLVIGASIISFVEILVCLAIHTYSKWRRSNRNKNKNSSFCLQCKMKLTKDKNTTNGEDVFL